LKKELAILILKFISTANCQAGSQSKTFKRMAGQKQRQLQTLTETLWENRDVRSPCLESNTIDDIL